MENNLISLFASIIAGSFIMILHELPKAIIYNLRNKEQSAQQKRNIWKVLHYIDPIGLIFCITTYSGFSKPYMYRIKDKKTNLILGITGLLSLFILFLIGLTIFRLTSQNNTMLTYTNNFEYFYKYFSYSFAYFLTLMSLTMFVVNLFPVSTFDLGLIIAGKSPSRYFAIIKNDYLIKMILILVLMFGLIQQLCAGFIQIFI